jgi:hypothetical protein
MYSGGTFQLQGHTTGQAVYVHGSANRLLQDTLLATNRVILLLQFFWIMRHRIGKSNWL